MTSTAAPRRRAIALAAVLAWAAAAPARGASPGELVEAVRSAHLERERAVTLRNVEIEIGLATLEIGHGILVPVAPIDGRTVELVLIGQAYFRVEPPDEIEAGQLELFTGQRSLETPVEEAVLVLTDPETVERLLDRPANEPPGASVWERAQAIHHRWLDGAERRDTGAEAGMFRALAGDQAYRRYFAAWCRSHEAGEFVFTHDPEDAEQVTLASFKRLEVRGWDRIRLARHIRFQQRKGRYLGVRLEDLGAWDIWLSAPWSGGNGAVVGRAGFEARHYELDVRIARRTLQLEGTARLSLETIDSGRRSLSLELHRDVEVRSVVDSAGRELFAFRSGPEVVVHLPEPSRAGERFDLEVAFGGRALEWVGRKTYDLVSTDNWYPHCGSIDRATYDVRLEWPAKLDLVGSGRVVASGRGERYRWERRRLDIPSIAFSMSLGDFDLGRFEMGRVELTLAFSREGGRPSPEARRRTADAIRRSLEFFESVFGEYPLEQLAVVVLPREFSQSYLGFVTLTDSVGLAAAAEPYSAGQWVRETTIAHEMAHQWWGNLVGWWSYRDQWLSEAMANYAGLLFYARSIEDAEVTLADLSAGWRATLEQPVGSGRTVESLGPIVLGNRLNSSEAGNGYRAIVYRKGAVVLSMLARVVGQERFLEMLGALAGAAEGKVLTTESFIEAMERMSGLDLQGFARQYVYGTGVPVVYYDHRFERDPAGGGWVVRGEARRVGEALSTVRIASRPDGTWDVVRDALPPESGAATALVVPYRVVSSAAEHDAERVYEGRRRTVHSGPLTLRGTVNRFEIEVPNEPEQFTLDPQGEILARFFSAEASPKRYARHRARDLLDRALPGEAEREFLRALELPLGMMPEAPVLAWLRNEESDRRVEDGAIRLALARIYLDQGRDDDAARQLEAVDGLLEADGPTFRMERDTLWARLELHRGAPEEAYRRLRRTMRLAAPDRTPRLWQARLLELRLKSEREAMTEAYALLAVAAGQTDHADDFEWAVAAARERGVDVAVLLEPGAARAPIIGP